MKLSHDEIKKILPHRDSMLLLDEAWEGGGSYKIKGDEFFLQGHFPDEPIVPGVILCEIMAQSACATIGEQSGKNVYLTGIDGVRIKNKVVTGDVFITEVTVRAHKGRFYFIDTKGFVDDTLCIVGSFSFAIV